MSRKRTIRVLIVDDHPLFRQGLASALHAAGDFEVAGEAGSGEEALERAARVRPDVVACDVQLPGANGVEVTRRLKVQLPAVAVVLLSAFDDEDVLFEAARVGAAGFFLKAADPEPLLDGIRRAARGEALLDERAIGRPAVASRVLREFQRLSGEGRGIEPLLVPLTPREMEILELIARGNSNKQIAQALFLSDQTVKNHITSILRKLAVNDRTQAVVFALRQGWIQVGQT
ncbi:MAG TPA: response regulator transcription factor [Chloroflexota bacterium]|nr:response regulator transcription factor [Chloroflexota bacterium]